MVWLMCLLIAWGAAALSCLRLCLAAARAAHPPARPSDGSPGRPGPAPYDLNLYETAFLAGGPERVADLVLVSMHLRRSLLLAHTGWATVVDPRGRDDVERTVIRAIGPDGQSRIAPVRAAAASAEPVRALADRLVAAGLAVPHALRGATAAALGEVRRAAVLIVVLALASVLLPGPSYSPGGPALVWFLLPLVLVAGCLLIVRIENHPNSPWASPAGQEWLDALGTSGPGRGAHRSLPAAVAVRGLRAVRDPLLRAALTGRRSRQPGPAS
ncbi:TIGR04222 domain-containing membrane protein [Streptomyces sp. NBC_01218]|uniref:TIGR04222 domain-containing membrane protein n=1 Tax=unclassified Streptomyces TaxID=2593676 RepID=UPI0023B9FC8E|nr:MULTISPECIES: TIGR04222 domain-containing membrane protein [unclassified Streptomyces]WEH38988.1 TIGR04222 domain-containing membrane protein [Streptomyces sp. AM 2-1-1]WSQ50648.1 TIGR04222 domain-containing membrane protein [Streptomyces sp. NBC_01218]